MDTRIEELARVEANPLGRSKVFRLSFQYLRSISTKLSSVDNQYMEHAPIDEPTLNEPRELGEKDELIEQNRTLKTLLELATRRNAELLKHFREAA
jgi:hypothetical protein